LEGKVARLYAATDEVEKQAFAVSGGGHKGGYRLPLACAKIYGFLTPHPHRCAQHLFLLKRAPFVGFADISPARGGITSRRRL